LRENLEPRTEPDYPCLDIQTIHGYDDYFIPAKGKPKWAYLNGIT
jgi:hypothetical protein